MAGKTLEERARELADAIPIREGADRNEDVYRPILAALRDAVAEARAEVERLEVQLAGCIIATGSPGPHSAKEGDYGWSPAYGDVAELRAEYDRLRSLLHRPCDQSAEFDGKPCRESMAIGRSSFCGPCLIAEGLALLGAKP